MNVEPTHACCTHVHVCSYGYITSMDNLLLLQNYDIIGEFWNKIHSSTYGIDSETQLLSQQKLLSHKDFDFGWSKVPSTKLVLNNASLFPQ